MEKHPATLGQWQSKKAWQNMQEPRWGRSGGAGLRKDEKQHVVSAKFPADARAGAIAFEVKPSRFLPAIQVLDCVVQALFRIDP